jgi:hypothetical protein
MRQGQQSRRGRGRGGRKGQNPLTRSYESNGPDVKIRGTAAHIAEKYISLARDALASGDLVGAENYLQHAEHYNRIIQAAQSQVSSHGGQPDGQNGGGSYRQRWNSETEGAEEESVDAAGDLGFGDEMRSTGSRGQGRRGPRPVNGAANAAAKEAGNGAEPAEGQADEGAPEGPLT